MDKTIYVEQECPRCKVGYRRPNGAREIVNNEPRGYIHICVNCTFIQTLNDIYPIEINYQKQE